MIPIPVPYEIQQRASDRAFMLRQEYSDRLTLAQNVEMEVVSMYAPERLGWQEVGAAIALWAMVIEVRV